MNNWIKLGLVVALAAHIVGCFPFDNDDCARTLDCPVDSSSTSTASTGGAGGSGGLGGIGGSITSSSVGGSGGSGGSLPCLAGSNGSPSLITVTSPAVAYACVYSYSGQKVCGDAAGGVDIILDFSNFDLPVRVVAAGQNGVAVKANAPLDFYTVDGSGLNQLLVCNNGQQLSPECNDEVKDQFICELDPNCTPPNLIFLLTGTKANENPPPAAFNVVAGVVANNCMP